MANVSESCLPQVNNQTVLLYEGYGGVPENLAINAIVWVILLIIFTLLRRFAWDYGRIALVNRNEEKQLMAKDTSSYNVWTSLFYGDQDPNKHGGSMESLDTDLHNQDRGLCSWVMAFVRVKDTDIAQKCGKDAMQYLTFQRYLMVYMVVVCVVSTGIIIPVNFTGENMGTASDFGHTTIANLDSESGLLWIHAVLSVGYLVLAVALMRHFSVSVKYEDDEHVTKTLMISGIPTDKCHKNIIVQHFHEGYPEITVADVQFAYNIEKLILLDKKRTATAEARLNSEMELSKTGHRPTIRPYKCGQCLCCGDSCGCMEVDAINYYTEEEATLKEKCEREKAKSYQETLGVAFVTFENVNMAERIYHDFQPACKAPNNPQPSSVHNELDIVEWDVVYAPAPNNIYWDKLALSGWKWWLKAIIINGLLVILLFFLTTPTIILTTLDTVDYKGAVQKLHGAWLVQFLPTMLLWTFTALLPNLVWYSDQYVGHWTRTAEHHAMMRKSFIFLVLMVLILPSLGLTSAKALFEFFVADQNKNLRWECIFLAGNGAFFVNYIITSAFIGTGLELLRFSELFVYGLKLLLARSSAERTSVRKHVIWEFQYGMQYAWVLCVFATIMAYSISCPIITPFGLVYMVFKHIVDRYNIYFAYKPSIISSSIHWTAINFVIIAVIFLQFNFVFFSVIRGGSDNPLSIFSIVVLFFTLLIFFGRVCFGWFRSYGHRKYRQFSEETTSDLSRPQDANNQDFVAGVLSEGAGLPKPSKTSTLTASDHLAHSYGTIKPETRVMSDPPMTGGLQDSL